MRIEVNWHGTPMVLCDEEALKAFMEVCGPRPEVRTTCAGSVPPDLLPESRRLAAVPRRPAPPMHWTVLAEMIGQRDGVSRQWLARRTGLTPDQVSSALAELKYTYNGLVRSDNGKWFTTPAGEQYDPKPVRPSADEDEAPRATIKRIHN